MARPSSSSCRRHANSSFAEHHRKLDMARVTNRRTFLKSAGAALAAPAFLHNLCTAAPNEVVRHASFGASGMAGTDLKEIASHPKVKLICVADVDLDRTKDVRKKFP